MRFRFFAIPWALAAAGVFGLSGFTPAAGAAGHSPGTSSQAAPAPPGSGLPRGIQSACPAPAGRLQEQCQLLVGNTPLRPHRGITSALSRDAITGPLLPSELRAAYGLTAAAASRGKGETVALVDAYRDPYIAADFTRYRQVAGLPACNAATGTGCLKVLNEFGATSPLPSATNTGWEDEAAVDVEMVSAICPNCHVDLFEANSASLTDLGTAENSAARVARFISNSWSGADFPGESQYDTEYFNHPGVAITFASGDYGYGAAYPASSQLVTAVGGTYLNTDSRSARGWSETVWSGQSTGPGTGTQSGCSSGEPKPAWQADPGCANRTQNDVAAVADAPDGIEFYSSASDCQGECQAYGTSVATPVIAAVYALAGTPARGTYPAEYPYAGGHTSDLYHVTSGSDGSCESSRLYLCNAAHSLGGDYNGPDGLGTPDGTAAFAPPRAGDIVSVINPGTYDLEAGMSYRLPPIRAYDSAPGQHLSYSATGLPRGLAINPSTGAISGTLPAPAPRSASVRVTVWDGTGAGTTVAFGIISVAPLTRAYRAGVGGIRLGLTGECLDDRGNSSRTGNLVQVWSCENDGAQRWVFRPGAAPGAAGAVMIHGRCLDITGRAIAAGSVAAIWRCTGYGNQQWLITGSTGALYNPQSGKCLSAPGRASPGTQLDIAPCAFGSRQGWTLPASPITSGVTGKCLDDSGDSSKNGARIDSYACNGSAAQRFWMDLSGRLRINGKCLNVTGNGMNDGTAVQLYSCNRAANELWGVSAYGMLESFSAQKCLADPGNAVANNTRLVLEDCYGQPGEIWAVS